MNLNHLTDLELLHYLDLYSDDPLIRRLVTVIANTRGALITDLENAGMHPDTWQFETDWRSMYPGDYIIHLRNELDYTEQELQVAQDDLEEVRKERDQLKARGIMELIQECQNEVKINQDLVKDAVKTVHAYKKENDDLRAYNANLQDKINVWQVMESWWN